ncbi:MAG: Uma2 family endonuclease [Caldilinea sp. CFX5]|nr:Uma2 family endonuclease [Caldilinea sp. CFX5]
MSLQSLQVRPTTKEIFYPETDGKPMAESDLHRGVMFAIIRLLQRFFLGRRVYVSGNLLIYYEQGNPSKSVSPDCFIVRDVEPHLRDIYKIWEEGKGPEVVFEVSSKTTRHVDLGKKMRLYAELGVQEYFIYDPTAEYLDPPLFAYELVGGGYVPMKPVKEEVVIGDLAFGPGQTEAPEYISRLMGLQLTLDEQNHLQFYDLATNQRLLDDAEALALAETMAKDAELRAEEEKQRAEQQKQRAEEAEAKIARLEAELARSRAER